MGGTSYDFEARSTRSLQMNYASVTAQDTRVFRQNALRRINEGMDPSQISLREARDSTVHPCTVPTILQLDVTGSMGRIPADLVKGELPNLMGQLIHGGCPDAALLFMAVGDQYSDEAPLQIGQFESGDAELDHWLTSCWIEAHGGNNDGESYSLGWLFAMNCVATDAWDKRKEKGLFISIGDEPLHGRMATSGLQKIFGRQYEKVVAGLEFGDYIRTEDVLRKVQQKWNVHHIQLGHVDDSFHKNSWAMLGEGYHEIGRETSPVPTVRQIVFDHMRSHGCSTGVEEGPATPAEERAHEAAGQAAPPADITPQPVDAPPPAEEQAFEDLPAPL